MLLGWTVVCEMAFGLVVDQILLQAPLSAFTVRSTSHWLLSWKESAWIGYRLADVSKFNHILAGAMAGHSGVDRTGSEKRAARNEKEALGVYVFCDARWCGPLSVG